MDVTSLVQYWSDNPGANYGLLLRGVSSSSVAYSFASASAAEVGIRPSLVIEYVDKSPVATVTPTPTASPVPATATATPTPSQTPTPSVTPTPTMPARTLISRRASTPPVVDGQLGEWRQPEELLLDASTVDTISRLPAPAPADASTVVRSMWDAGWLYFAAQVSDDVLLRDSTEIWWDDGIELAFDGANDQVSGNGDDHQVNVASDGTVKEAGLDDLPGAVVAAVRREGGYNLEIACCR